MQKTVVARGATQFTGVMHDKRDCYSTGATATGVTTVNATSRDTVPNVRAGKGSRDAFSVHREYFLDTQNLLAKP